MDRTISNSWSSIVCNDREGKAEALGRFGFLSFLLPKNKKRNYSNDFDFMHNNARIYTTYILIHYIFWDI
jgi:hypothetical protein